MPRSFFIAPLICQVVADGTTECAPKVNPRQVNYVAACQRFDVPNAQCLVLASGDLTGAVADSNLVQLVADNFDTTIASVPQGIKNRVQNGLNAKGIALTVTNYATVRDFLNALGRVFDPNFVAENFWIAD